MSKRPQSYQKPAHEPSRDHAESGMDAESAVNAESGVDVKGAVDVENIVSSGDCTGLMPTPPQDEGAAESYAALYAIHKPKTNEDGKPSDVGK